MDRQKYYNEIKDILLLDGDVNEETVIEIDSMASLLLIVFLDENFNKSISEDKIKGLKSVGDITYIIGADNIT